MDSDLPPYSRRISRAVALDQEESLLKGLRDLSSRIREVTTILESLYIEVRLFEDPVGPGYEAFNDFMPAWDQLVLRTIDTALDIKIALLDKFTIFAPQLEQSPTGDLIEVLKYFDTRKIDHTNNEASNALNAKLDLTISLFEPGDQVLPDTIDSPKPNRLMSVLKTFWPMGCSFLFLLLWGYYAKHQAIRRMGPVHPVCQTSNFRSATTWFLGLMPVAGGPILTVVRLRSASKQSTPGPLGNTAVVFGVSLLHTSRVQKKEKIFHRLQIVKSKMNDCISHLPVIQRIHDIVREDIADHLERIHSLEFESDEGRRETMDGLKLSMDLYRQVGSAIDQFGSSARAYNRHS
ncbi:hypothetical protein CPB86DRAFT_779265 [Serendipita vermifera]|nr:hypothetical protein CPB86DRAFT_779265 [Serendipita vermifera]